MAKIWPALSSTTLSPFYSMIILLRIILNRLISHDCIICITGRYTYSMHDTSIHVDRWGFHLGSANQEQSMFHAMKTTIRMCGLWSAVSGSAFAWRGASTHSATQQGESQISCCQIHCSSTPFDPPFDPIETSLFLSLLNFLWYLDVMKCIRSVSSSGGVAAMPYDSINLGSLG